MSSTGNIKFNLQDGTPVAIINIPGYYKLIFNFSDGKRELVWPETHCIVEANRLLLLEPYEFEALNILNGMKEKRQ